MKKILLAIASLAITVSSQAQKNSDEKVLGNNLITATPLSILDKGFGIGLSYERIIDNEQKLAFVLPVDFIFDDLVDNTWSNNQSNSLFYTYVSPGLIFYPAGLKRVNYGVGPNLVFGYGSGNEWRMNNNGIERFENFTNVRLGLMVNNYLLINMAKHISMQLNFGMGVRYINSYTYDTFNSKDPISLMGQFKLAFGYRF